VTNGTTYYYVVQAVNSGGVSGNSAEASATPNVETASMANSAPPLDGSDTGAWANLAFVPIQHQFQGASTDTAAYKVLWDANNLYLLVSVQDSYLIAPTAANVWSGETVELYFSGADSKSTTYGLTDFQYAFPYGNGGATIAESYHSPASLKNVTYAQQAIDGGFQMAITMPWSTLGSTPVAGQQYGFDLMIDTASAQGTRQGKLGWWATSDGTWSNPSLMATGIGKQQLTAQTISFTAPSTATFGSTIALSATASSGLAPVFTLVSGPATLNDSQLTFTGVARWSSKPARLATPALPRPRRSRRLSPSTPPRRPGLHRNSIQDLRQRAVHGEGYLAFERRHHVLRPQRSGQDLRLDRHSDRRRFGYPARLASSITQTIGFHGKTLIADETAFVELRHLTRLTPDDRYRWRSGVKHDCAKIMEIVPVGRQLVNGFQAPVDIEDSFLFPMMKGSEVAHGAAPSRMMLVTTGANGTGNGSDRRHRTQDLGVLEPPWRAFGRAGQFDIQKPSAIFHFWHRSLHVFPVEGGHMLALQETDVFRDRPASRQTGGSG